jgi:predicted peroxiredoxin
MTHYLFIESRDPFTSNDTPFIVETAVALQRRGHSVSVFLVQNGTLAARQRAAGSRLPHLIAEGVQLLADDFSLRERGIEAAELVDGIQSATLDTLVELLAQPDTKALWH